MIQLTWLGADGTYWDLARGKVQVDGNSSNGVEGLGEPKWNRNTISSAGTDGQRRTGQRSRADPRQGYLPVVILGDNELDWLALSQAWWNSWSPDAPGTLTAIMPDGGIRFIQACLIDDDSYAPQRDPGITATEQTAVTWVADDPFWRGPVIESDFQVTDGSVDFFNGGHAPPFNLAPGNTTSNVVMTNPGDLEAWPTYTITGPSTSFSVAINGAAVSGTIAVQAGERLVIQTDPSQQVAFLYKLDGSVVNVTPQLTNVHFSSIPTGATVQVAAAIIGTGSLSVAFNPRYRRAW